MLNSTNYYSFINFWSRNQARKNSGLSLTFIYHKNEKFIYFNNFFSNDFTLPSQYQGYSPYYQFKKSYGKLDNSQFVIHTRYLKFHEPQTIFYIPHFFYENYQRFRRQNFRLNFVRDFKFFNNDNKWVIKRDVLKSSKIYPNIFEDSFIKNLETSSIRLSSIMNKEILSQLFNKFSRYCFFIIFKFFVRVQKMEHRVVKSNVNFFELAIRNYVVFESFMGKKKVYNKSSLSFIKFIYFIRDSIFGVLNNDVHILRFQYLKYFKYSFKRFFNQLIGFVSIVNYIDFIRKEIDIQRFEIKKKIQELKYKYISVFSKNYGLFIYFYNFIKFIIFNIIKDKIANKIVNRIFLFIDKFLYPIIKLFEDKVYGKRQFIKKNIQKFKPYQVKGRKNRFGIPIIYRKLKPVVYIKKYEFFNIMASYFIRNYCMNIKFYKYIFYAFLFNNQKRNKYSYLGLPNLTRISITNITCNVIISANYEKINITPKIIFNFSKIKFSNTIIKFFYKIMIKFMSKKISNRNKVFYYFKDNLYFKILNSTFASFAAFMARKFSNKSLRADQAVIRRFSKRYFYLFKNVQSILELVQDINLDPSKLGPDFTNPVTKFYNYIYEFIRTYFIKLFYYNLGEVNFSSDIFNNIKKVMDKFVKIFIKKRYLFIRFNRFAQFFNSIHNFKPQSFVHNYERFYAAKPLYTNNKFYGNKQFFNIYKKIFRFFEKIDDSIVIYKIQKFNKFFSKSYKFYRQIKNYFTISSINRVLNLESFSNFLMFEYNYIRTDYQKFLFFIYLLKYFGDYNVYNKIFCWICSVLQKQRLSVYGYSKIMQYFIYKKIFPKTFFNSFTQVKEKYMYKKSFDMFCKVVKSFNIDIYLIFYSQIFNTYSSEDIKIQNKIFKPQNLCKINKSNGKEIQVNKWIISNSKLKNYPSVYIGVKFCQNKFIKGMGRYLNKKINEIQFNNKTRSQTIYKYKIIVDFIRFKYSYFLDFFENRLPGFYRKFNFNAKIKQEKLPYVFRFQNLRIYNFSHIFNYNKFAMFFFNYTHNSFYNNVSDYYNFNILDEDLYGCYDYVVPSRRGFTIWRDEREVSDIENINRTGIRHFKWDSYGFRYTLSNSFKFGKFNDYFQYSAYNYYSLLYLPAVFKANKKKLFIFL